MAPFYGSDVDPYTETLNRFEASLAKLSMDYVDLYLPLTPSQLACSGGYHGSRAILLLTDACSAVALKCCLPCRCAVRTHTLGHRYLLHWPVLDAHPACWRAFEKIFSDGRAKSIGVSNYTPCHLEWHARPPAWA